MPAATKEPKAAKSAKADAYTELCDLVRKGSVLGSVNALLNWDQETYMPAAGAAHRAEQQSMLAELVHERMTSKRIGELLKACEADQSLVGKESSETARNIREMRRDYDLATKLPGSLVAELAKVGSQAQEVWKHARANDDFKSFAPWLDRMMSLSRQKAECYGVKAGGELYDALLDEYEPGMTAREVESIFTPLRERLTDLIGRVAKSGKKIDTSCIEVKVDPKLQHEFGLQILKAIHFDLDAGRLDVTTHPFCSGMAPGDTRLTTRYRGEKFTDALYGTMHEAGHGLYEQGLPKLGSGKKPGHFGTPLGDSISLGIHESQSRMWENFVGRSKPFWKWALPRANKAFEGALKGVTVNEMFAAVNTTSPSLIRVEADEGTYNMHVMIRFELERALLHGDLAVKDLPAAWNEKYKSYLGVKVPDDRRGCLQDVHWSFGLIGYFPTYTLGNLYSAQFWETILTEIPDLEDQMAKGEIGQLREWLRDKIHKHGKRYRAAELCKKVTGKPLSADPLLRHLSSRAGAVYGV